MKMKMKINNHEEYVYAFEMMRALVDAIEEYRVVPLEHPVKGSLEPQHPLDDSGPRGHAFFKTLDTKVNEPRGVCPGQLT